MADNTNRCPGCFGIGHINETDKMCEACGGWGTLSDVELEVYRMLERLGLLKIVAFPIQKS